MTFFCLLNSHHSLPSTETALIQVTDGLSFYLDGDDLSVLTLCDLSDTWDSVYHSILLDSLRSFYRIFGTDLRSSFHLHMLTFSIEMPLFLDRPHYPTPAKSYKRFFKQFFFSAVLKVMELFALLNSFYSKF